MSTTTRVLAVAMVALVSFRATAESSGSSCERCAPNLSSVLGGRPGIDLNLDYGQIYALCVYDAGGGPRLFAGGYFTRIGGCRSRGIAQWDGTRWLPVGDQLNGDVDGMLVHDDGSGPMLYAAGVFTKIGDKEFKGIARWDGVRWRKVGMGFNSGARCLAVYDDGTGPALYAGGYFTTAEGKTVNHVAKWDGKTWSALGEGMNAQVRALEVFPGPNGMELVAGGNFTTAGGSPANRIARWNGAQWLPLGGGVTMASGDASVAALAIFFAPSGPRLYVGGQFNKAAGVSTNHLAFWNGTNWGAAGGLVEDVTFSKSVQAIRTINLGAGPQLFVGGTFQKFGSITMNNIARWNGVSWSAVGGAVSGPSPTPMVFDFCRFDAPDGTPQLIAGGRFERAEVHRSSGVAAWNGAAWTPLGAGLNDLITAMCRRGETATDPTLYIGGLFTWLDHRPISGIAEWNGEEWRSLGSGFWASSYPGVRALRMCSRNGQRRLVAGGQFVTAGAVVVNGVAEWGGESWLPIGSGVSDPTYVNDIASIDDGDGELLYVTGSFTKAGGGPASLIARWNGSAWVPLGSGLHGESALREGRVLLVEPREGGSLLYVGGVFDWAGSSPASNIAVWDGAAWSALGSGVNGPVNSMVLFDDGSGPALFVGGQFTVAGGIAASNIAKWQNGAWHPVGAGVAGEFARVLALEVIADEEGPTLWVAGKFSTAGGAPVAHLAKWTMGEWVPLITIGTIPHLTAELNDLAETTDAETGRRRVWIGGRFQISPRGDSFLTSWNICGDEPILTADLDGDGAVGATDLGILLGLWGSRDPLADLDCNGLVEGGDLAYLLSRWREPA